MDTIKWPSVIPAKRWQGFRRDFKGTTAFSSLENFKIAQQSELYSSLSQHERETLGRLLKRGQKVELDIFVRTHGANPLFSPQEEAGVKVGVAKADVVHLETPSEPRALQAILKGDVVHVLFQAGEATRFDQGPFYKLNPIPLARSLTDQQPELIPLLESIDKKRGSLDKLSAEFLIDGPLGPKQLLMIRAALRRVVQMALEGGLFPISEASAQYDKALKNQKILFFVSRQQGVNDHHDEALREKFHFYGFDPANLVTIEQESVPGIRLDEEGNIFLMETENGMDAAGHLYALLQAIRPGGFTSYTESGRPIKPMEMDAFGYLSSRGGRLLSIIRINDMDRHTTEIINPKALSYALSMFEKGYSNVIEGVANPSGQKGGTGTTFESPDLHILTETHENSFPSLSRVFESAMKEYLEKNKGRHPAYNAMRQWADLGATREVLKEYGGRIVFVPRNKTVNGESSWYVGVDMPMGDLSLLGPAYKSRMFQFAGPNSCELLIHDMKQLDQLSIYLRTAERQLDDPDILAAAKELLLNETVPFKMSGVPRGLYGAPTPEFENC